MLSTTYRPNNHYHYMQTENMNANTNTYKKMKTSHLLLHTFSYLNPPEPLKTSMASNPKLSYHRLQQEIWFDEADEYDLRRKVLGRSRTSRFRKFHIRRKLRVKIPNLKRFLRRKTSVIKVAWNGIYKRLKESRSHFGDLFAGNYLFMQVTPSPLKYADNGVIKSLVKGHGHDLHGLSSGYSVARVV